MTDSTLGWKTGLANLLTTAKKKNACFVHVVRKADKVAILIRNGSGALQDMAQVSPEQFDEMLDELKGTSRSLSSEDERVLSLVGADGVQINALCNIFVNETSICLAMDLRGTWLKTVTIDRLGMTKQQQERVERWSLARSGLIVVCGHIASGKASTADALLQHAASVDRNRFVYRIDRYGPYSIPSVHYISVAMHDPLAVRNLVYRLVSADANVIGIGNPDTDDVISPAIARCALDASRRGALILIEMVANDPISALGQLDKATGESCWGAVVGVIGQSLDWKTTAAMKPEYHFLEGPLSSEPNA